MHDLVIRGGSVIDGTGAPAVEADVAIEGDRIVAVGEKLGAGKREIDAQGHIVTPGFVDMHTHFDAQVTWDPYLTPSSWHGVTSVVMGNCGVGFAPAKPDRHDWLIGLMEGVEDIPGAAMHEGIEWEWETFPEYLDAVERKPHAIDFGCQVPHGALRAYVMGDRGADNEAATPEDIEAMYRIVKEGIEAGALGFSTSRTLLHKSIDGVPVPGTFAARDELFGIGRALRDTKRGIFQMATEHLQVPREFEWMRVLSAEMGRPVLFNLSQTDFNPKLWRDLVQMLDEAAAEGLEVYGQAAGRAIGVMMNWEATAHPFARHPTFLELMKLGREERKAALKTPEVRAKILGEEGQDLDNFAKYITLTFSKMFALGERVDYEPSPDQSIKAIAERTGKRPAEVAYDAMLENDCKAMLYFPLFNYSDQNLDLLYELHQHPRVKMGLSDAGAHCGAVCDGGMPTFMLTHWTRDRTRGPKLPLEHIVKRQTSETAHIWGMRDRGVLAPGYLADVNVIDYEGLRFEHPELAYDLPAGGRRLIQKAHGYKATIKRGIPIAEAGEPTGEMPGSLVRGPQAAPNP